MESKRVIMLGMAELMILLQLLKAGVKLDNSGACILGVRVVFFECRFDPEDPSIQLFHRVVRGGFGDALRRCRLLKGLFHLRHSPSEFLLQLMPPLPQTGVNLINASQLRLHFITEALDTAGELRNASIKLGLEGLEGPHLRLHSGQCDIAEAVFLLLRTVYLRIQALLEADQLVLEGTVGFRPVRRRGRAEPTGPGGCLPQAADGDGQPQRGGRSRQR
mmetsp:Transcript_2505/g.5983  ORF Transcript_2505/g.5983 Transcript_2505/m.5983 type:complete len:219 (+) Transcript_2505:814-1470(+)